MREQIMKALKAKGYAVSGASTLEVTDPKVQGYTPERNVAQIKLVGGIFVNPYRGHWYKPGEFVQVDSVDEVVRLIEERGKVVS